MNKRKSPRTAAVIDIGSNLLRMRVCQLKKGELSDIDCLEYPMHLGHEVFHDGKISFASLRDLSNILHGFSGVMEEYGIDQYVAVATTALREASNRDYVTDQLKIQNDIDVTVLEDSQEKSLIFSEILRSIDAMGAKKKQNSLIAFIGTGSTGITIFDGERMVFSINIPIGSLKLRDILSSVEDETDRYYAVMEEYLDIIIGHIALPPSNSAISHLVLTGNDIELIAKLCGAKLSDGRYRIEAKKITGLFEEVRHMTPLRISTKYQLSEEEAESLYSSLIIYNRLIMFVEPEYVLCPKINLWDALLRQMLTPKAKDDYEKQVKENALSCAEVLGQAYNCPAEHAQFVRSLACKIFDKMKGIHGLPPKMRLLLELSSILHDCGHFVNSRHYRYSTFTLIQNMDLYGMTSAEMLMTAYIASYNDRNVPADPVSFEQLSRKTRLAVSKLAAIFRLANALDKSQKQKISECKVKLEDNKLLITGKASRDCYLERWAFDACAPMFEEVFGISPEMHIKSFSAL